MIDQLSSVRSMVEPTKDAFQSAASPVQMEDFLVFSNFNFGISYVAHKFSKSRN